jgi:hypothetical protein
VILMGVGATIIAALAGHDLGVRLVELEQAREVANKQFADSMRTWRANLLKQWRTSSELGSVDKAKRTRYEPTEQNEQFAEPTRERTPNKPVRSVKPTNERMSKIRQILDTVLERDGLIASISYVAEQLALEDAPDGDKELIQEFKLRNKGYVHQVRKNWMREKGIEEKK